MKRKVIIFSLVLASSITLYGCTRNKTTSHQQQLRSKTHLEIYGANASEMLTDSKGNYDFIGDTAKPATIRYTYKLNSKTFSHKVHSKKGGKFKFRVALPNSKDKLKVSISAKATHQRMNSQIVTIKNDSSSFHDIKNSTHLSPSIKKAESKVSSLYADSTHTTLGKNIDIDNIDDARGLVDALDSSKIKTNLQKLVTKADKLYADQPAEYSSSSSKKSTNTNPASQYRKKYKRVSLENFTDTPDKYDQKLIKVTGTVTYIQRNSDNNTMDYIVLSNSDNTAATVAEVEVEDMHSHHISEGSNITILGGGLTKTVKLNGKTLESDIIEDFVQ